MSTLEEYEQALNKFCADLSAQVARYAEEGGDEAVAAVLDAIRATIANMLLCELECERVLHRG